MWACNRSSRLDYSELRFDRTTKQWIASGLALQADVAEALSETAVGVELIGSAVSRAVRLITQFLAEHTGARTAHLITGQDNTASLRVARSVRAMPRERWTDDRGHTMIRHTLEI